MRPARPQHFPATETASRSQVRPVPQEAQTVPRSPQAMSVWEAGATQAPVCVQHPRQVLVLHFDWHWLWRQPKPGLSVQFWQSTPPIPHSKSEVGATMHTPCGLQQPSLQLSTLHS